MGVGEYPALYVWSMWSLLNMAPLNFCRVLWGFDTLIIWSVYLLCTDNKITNILLEAASIIKIYNAIIKQYFKSYKITHI